MGSKKVVTCVACVILPHLAKGLRKARERANAEVQTKRVAGVTIHNYNLRHLQHEEVTADADSNDFDWVVNFQEGASDEVLAKFCGGSCKVMGHPSSGGVPFVAVRSSEDGLQKMLEANPTGIAFAEPDLAVFIIPEIPSEMQTVDHWGLDRIGKSRARHTGRGVHIYVMDTGTRVSHQDFGGRAIATLDTIAGNGIPIECETSGDPLCGQDTHGHGTHCAGSAGGKDYGVATEAIIHGMKVCCGAGTNTIAGLDWIAQKGIMPGLVTMSLGSWGNSMSSKAAVDRVVESGIAVFVSAGNNDVDSCEKTFAFIESTVTVGASDEANERAWFSNYGACLDIYAPGVSIPSLSNADDTSIVSMSGTSMATPLTAGAGALLLEAEPTLAPAQLKERLQTAAASGQLGDMQPGDPNLLLNVDGVL